VDETEHTEEKEDQYEDNDPQKEKHRIDDEEDNYTDHEEYGEDVEHFGLLVLIFMNTAYWELLPNAFVAESHLLDHDAQRL
jgi:hypothetical protein